MAWLGRISAISTLGIALSFETSTSAFARPVKFESEAVRLSQLYVGDRPMMTTYGRGIVNSPAETAEITFSFGTTDPMSGNYEEAVEPMTEVMLQPIKSEIEALGVPSENIDIEIDRIDPRTVYPGQPLARIVVTLDAPTFTQIDRVRETVETATYDDGSFYMYSAYPICFVEDFLPLENQARLAAIEDARGRIQAMAEAVNARVGGVLSTIEIHSYRPVSSDCTPGVDANGIASDTPEVTSELGVLMTFEMLN
ncbi:MAG: SIMPL domain-containing protein [Cyanobacteria bacterium SID2]|nr:SIMPL domain-containing protein [Cyanobacteria bacterium SID2]MBP0003380.1 SIMPL domain-containing protein [Cyanobacteria bacterium SBC]